MTMQSTRDRLRALANAATTRDELRADVELGKRLTGTIDAGADGDYYPAMERIFAALPALLDQLDAAEARIQAVRAIHRDLYESMPGFPYCDECDRDWPCPTIRALDGDA